MTNCPCCSNRLLRHIRTSSIYWFCSHCRQEMPNLWGVKLASTIQGFNNIVHLSHENTN